MWSWKCVGQCHGMLTDKHTDTLPQRDPLCMLQRITPAFAHRSWFARPLKLYSTDVEPCLLAARLYYAPF